MPELSPVASRVVELIGDPRSDPAVAADIVDPPGHRSSLALCVIESIQSTGVRFTSVVQVLNRYRAARTARGADARIDGSPELLASYEVAGGVDGWAASIGTGNRISTQPGAPLKAAAIRDAAQALVAAGINTAEDLRSALTDDHRSEAMEKAWRAVPGQRSGVTWHYLLMLAGVPGVKPDRMILRFVAEAIGTSPARVTTAEAVRLVSEAADQLGVSATALDHAIWRFQRRR